MEKASREVLCNSCSHLKVCKHVEDMVKTILQVGKMRVETIEPIKISVSCNMYRQDSVNVRQLSTSSKI